MARFCAILPAAGSSTRFGSAHNKLFQDLAGSSVVARATAAFLCRSDVDRLVIATHDQPALRQSLGSLVADPRVAICAGGQSRADTVRLALGALSGDAPWVAVHDAARPLISQGLITRTFAAAQTHGAAVPALPVHLTIKQAAGPLPAPVHHTVPRHELWAMQTPQFMHRADLAAAFDSCPIPLDQITDDAQLLELSGKEVWLIPGEVRNVKITIPADLALARHLLA